MNMTKPRKTAKRLAALLLCMLLAGPWAALAEAEASAAPEATVAPEATAAPDAAEATEETHLTVGGTTPMDGTFFNGLWGNNTSDVDVRGLLHAYNLVMWDGEVGQFEVDPSVVSGIVVTEDDAGNRHYTLTLYGDLVYSDGSRVTAKDYAFYWLLNHSPEVEALGGVSSRADYLLGYEEYRRKLAPTEGAGENGLAEGERYEAGVKRLNDGTHACLAGLRLVSEDTLTFIVKAEALPFFYELGLLSCEPYPIGEIAPGVQVKDDGEGCYLANIDENVQEPVFTQELLERTLMDPETGYVLHPRVISGPYNIVSFDGETAEFEKNTYYKGDSEGRKPIIDKITFTRADNDTMIEKLRDGEFDLLNRVTRADVIAQGMQLTRDGGFAMTNYPRTGVGVICFACERPAVSTPAMRQAIAWCMDRDTVVKDYIGNFGMRADGYYGMGQWMMGIIQGSIVPPVEAPENPDDEAAQAAYEATLAEWKALNLDGLTEYTVDLDRAAALLDGEGWILNEDGLREKDGETLSLVMAYPEGSKIGESLQTCLVDNLEKLGVTLTLQPAPMAEVLRRFYKQPLDEEEEVLDIDAEPAPEGEDVIPQRDVDMIFLASNFDVLFDPAAHFTAEEDGTPDWSYTNNGDKQLYDLAVAMRQTDAKDPLEYMRRWIAFEERFNENLPMLPIYTNIYFDFYTDRLQDYPVDKNLAWSTAIVGAQLLKESPQPTPEPTPEPSPEPADGAQTPEDADESDDGLVDIA